MPTITTTDELARPEAWALLTEGVNPQSVDCRFLRGYGNRSLRKQGSRRTFQKLEELFNHKRADLFPEEPDTSLTIGAGSGKRYRREALLAFKAWLTMPAGHYGTPANPTLDLYAAAAHVGCDKATITNNLRDKALPDWSRNGKGEILTFAISDLDSLKSTWADGKTVFTVSGVAKELGWTVQKVKKACSRESTSARGLTIATESKKLRHRSGGINARTISAETLKRVQESIQEQKRKPGMVTESELVKTLGIDPKNGSGKRELSECLGLWSELGMLPHELAIVETLYTPSHRAKPQITTQELMTYDEERFRKLWERTCSANTGRTHLIILLPFGKQKPLPEVDDEMRDKGFIGHRLQEAKRLANVIKRFPEGDGNRAAWICERVNPKNPQFPRHVDVLKELFAAGALLVKDYEARLAGKNLSRRSNEVIRAEKELGLESKRLSLRGPWHCKIDGQTWPDPSAGQPGGAGPTAQSPPPVDVSPPNQSPEPFVPTAFMQRILTALAGHALTADLLQKKLTIDRRNLYRIGLKPLQKAGKVRNNRRVGGYYRPDAPPPKFAEFLEENTTSETVGTL